MGNITRKIEKEVTFFKFESITSETIKDLLEFCGKNKHVYVTGICIEITKNNPVSIEIQINTNGMRGIVYEKLEPNRFYYFHDAELKSALTLNDVDILNCDSIN